MRQLPIGTTEALLAREPLEKPKWLDFSRAGRKPREGKQDFEAPAGQERRWAAVKALLAENNAENYEALSPEVRRTQLSRVVNLLGTAQKFGMELLEHL